MTRYTLLAALLAAPALASAQSLLFPKFFDRHYVHLATKPPIALGAYEGLRLAHVPKGVSTVAAIVGPSLVADVVWEIKDPGHFTDGKTIKDNLQDSFAASLGLIVRRMRGWKRLVAVALWGTVEFGVGLHKWGEP